MTIHITTADPTSADAVALLAELTDEMHALYDTGGDGAFSPSDVQVERAAFVLATLNGQAVGCGALRPFSTTHVEIKRVYVRPSARGRGISRHIMAYLEKLAREFGYTHAQLETGVKQPAAISLYESIGYAPIPCYGDYDDDPLSVCFAKAL